MNKVGKLCVLYSTEKKIITMLNRGELSTDPCGAPFGNVIQVLHIETILNLISISGVAAYEHQVITGPFLTYGFRGVNAP